MRARHLFLAVIPLLALGLLAPACSTDSDRLTVYSGRTKDLISPLLDQFSDETGIKIDVRYGDSADLALLVDTEGDNTDVDVFISQSPGAVGFLDAQKRLAQLDEAELDLVDEQFRSGSGDWVGLSGRVRVLVYNTDLVDEAELPDSVLDLTDEQFRGRVAVAPTNGSFQDFVTAMRVELGEDVASDWLDGMAANDAKAYSNNTAIVEAVTRGEIEMGLVNHYYLARALAEDPSLPGANHFFVEGDLGSLLISTAASIIEGTDQRDDARALVDFLLSKAAQEFFSQETFEYPLARGVAPSDALPPLDSIPTTSIDLDELGGGLARTAEIIQDSGLDG
ncbi:extracellular solute-binding protein [Actinospongicola halichondriae]|uniref:extracellular solute-binding protein n=1 Tax=Actinospongicola halichondriae TaxID=3236844 RepID=UPI003D486538